MFRSLVVAAALIFVGCASVDPARKTDLDSWRANFTARSQQFPAAQQSRMPYAEGQWVEYLEVNEKGEPARIRYSVLGEEGGGRWIEVDRVDYYGRNIGKMLVVAAAWDKPETWEVKRFITKHNDEPAQEAPSMVLGMMSKNQMGMLKMNVSTTEVARDTVTTPAGVFTDAMKIDSKTESAVGTFESTVWIHDAVPVTGMAKSKSKDDKVTYEVIEFGTTGATSAITEVVQPAAI